MTRLICGRRHIVMAGLKDALIKENAFIVQRRNAESVKELSYKLDNIRFYKETPTEKLAHEMHDIPQRSSTFLSARFQELEKQLYGRDN